MDAPQLLKISDLPQKIDLPPPSMNCSSNNMNNIKSSQQNKNNNLKRTKMKKLMGDNNNSNKSTDLLEVKSQEDLVDEDLKGIPDHILKIMENQPIINIMTMGHVSHGKTTLMQALCNENTTRDSQGLKANKTIKLGYTSCKIYKCLSCIKPNCYFSRNSNLKSKDIKCNNYDYCGNTYLNKGVLLIRHISFIDCPGHLSYMGKMIQACSVSDKSLLIVDSSSKFPQAQTVRHFETSYLLGLLNKNSNNNGKNNLLVCQNKIDLVKPNKACIISYINSKMEKNEKCKINIHAMRVTATIIKHIKPKQEDNDNNDEDDNNNSIKYAHVRLDHPIAANIGDKVAFTRKDKKNTWVMKNTGILKKVKILTQID